MRRCEMGKYIIGCGNLRDHVSRLNVTSAMTDNENSRSVGSMKLSYNEELNLNLYRHWSLYESLRHTDYTAAKFKIWKLTDKGNQLDEFLAELGLPKMQCEQKFNSMDLELRTNVTEIFKEKVGKYGLEDITYNSFTAAFGFRHKFCAADVAHAVRALLEYHQHSISQVNYKLVLFRVRKQ